MTYQQEIAISMCEKHRDMPTRTLARLIRTQNPLDFTETGARTMVQRIRGEHKTYPIKNTSHLHTTEMEKKMRIQNNFKLPESDYQKIEPFYVPKLNNNILFLTDIHLPYQDNKAVEIALNYGINHNVNAIYLNGDTMDFYQASRFIKDRRLRDLAGELEVGREFLKMLKETFNCPIYYKIGNHEERWENYLRTKAPELLGIADFELSNLLRFREYGVTEIKGKQITYMGKLALLHGHEFGQSVFSPVNPARGLYVRAKDSSVIGHHHQTSEHTEKSLNGEIVKTWSVGCLCGLSPEYYPYNKWNHGFARIQTDGDAYEIDNLSIINGKVR